MTKFHTIFLATALAVTSYSQVYNPSRVAPTTFFSEFLGSAVIYSVNVDHIFHENAQFKMAFRAGVGAARGRMAVPLGICGLREIGFASYLEFGAGYTPTFFSSVSSVGNSINSFNARLGYRSQLPDGGFFWNLAALYVHNGYFNDDNVLNRLWVGVGIGYTIRR